MAYLVLGRKWRPRTFNEVIGQQPVVRTLQNALARNRVAHAMLFAGVRGVGKTTLARIMAKALNCREGMTTDPCDLCESCRAIAEGNSADLHEIDGASNRGIQEIRELKENIRFFPSRDRFKIVIIDEVHMLTNEAFNALLKTLEEPPAHVYFMFATTEAHKIPITILSRCQRYELRRVPGRELAAHFNRIATAEKVVLEDRALDLIVREAGGSVRDGLSLLDQVLSFAATGGADETQHVAAEDVAQVLGLVDSRVLEQMAAALLAGDTGRCLELLDAVNVAGVDLKRLSLDLVAFFRGLLVCKVTREPAKLLDGSEQELSGMRDLAAGHGVETLHRLFELLIHSIDEMQYSTHPRLVLETALMRGAQSGGVAGVEEILARLDTLLSGHGTSTATGPAGAPLPAGNPRPAGRAAGRSDSEAAGPAAGLAAGLAASLAGGRESSPAGHGTPSPSYETSHGPATAKDAREPAWPPQTAAPAAAGGGPEVRLAEPVPSTPDLPSGGGPTAGPRENRARDVREFWEHFVAGVMERTAWMAHTLRMATSVREEKGAVILDFDDASDCRLLQEPDNKRMLTEYARDFFRKELTIGFQVGGAAPGRGRTSGDATPREERRLLADDPLVRMTTEIMDGRVVGIRTGPRGGR